jgi:hypothetical protein
LRNQNKYPAGAEAAGGNVLSSESNARFDAGSLKVRRGIPIALAEESEIGVSDRAAAADDALVGLAEGLAARPNTVYAA